uniref:Uncharacterized protein n=1 Tax=Megaselia scalaris TaxID=36166 RepID=T1GKP3_MEGSC
MKFKKNVKKEQETSFHNSFSHQKTPLSKELHQKYKIQSMLIHKDHEVCGHFKGNQTCKVVQF